MTSKHDSYVTVLIKKLNICVFSSSVETHITGGMELPNL